MLRGDDVSGRIFAAANKLESVAAAAFGGKRRTRGGEFHADSF